jgi:hypothetical protein
MIGELFYLQILLRHRSAFRFEDLRTIHNRVYPTYQEAARALGLFEDESEVVCAVRKAVAAYHPSRLTTVSLCTSATRSPNTGNYTLGDFSTDSLRRFRSQQ